MSLGDKSSGCAAITEAVIVVTPVTWAVALKQKKRKGLTSDKKKRAGIKQRPPGLSAPEDKVTTITGQTFFTWMN